MFSHSFLPVINKPTRAVTTAAYSSATCIDHIYINNITHSTNSLQGILYTDVTDHFPVFYIDVTLKKQDTCNIPRMKRFFTDKAKEKFSKDLGDIDWTHIYDCDDAQLAFSSFHQQYSKIYDNCFPLKVTKEGYKTRKEWLSPGLKNSIERKNKMFLQAKLYHNPELLNEYKSYRNKLTLLIRKAEISHHKALFATYKNNIKKSWGIIKNY